MWQIVLIPHEISLNFQDIHHYTVHLCEFCGPLIIIIGLDFSLLYTPSSRADIKDIIEAPHHSRKAFLSHDIFMMKNETNCLLAQKFMK